MGNKTFPVSSTRKIKHFNSEQWQRPLEKEKRMSETLLKKQREQIKDDKTITCFYSLVFVFTTADCIKILSVFTLILSPQSKRKIQVIRII